MGDWDEQFELYSMSIELRLGIQGELILHDTSFLINVHPCAKRS